MHSYFSAVSWLQPAGSLLCTVQAQPLSFGCHIYSSESRRECIIIYNSCSLTGSPVYSLETFQRIHARVVPCHVMAIALARRTYTLIHEPSEVTSHQSLRPWGSNDNDRSSIGGVARGVSRCPDPPRRRIQLCRLRWERIA